MPALRVTAFFDRLEGRVHRDLLGHASIRTTEIYAKVMQSQMNDAIDVLNKLNNHGYKRAE